MPGRLPAPLVPPEARRGLWQRLLLVCGVALLIAAANWATQPAQGPMRRGIDVALVYAFAISLLTWAFIDLLRFVLRRPLRAAPPGYWPPPTRAALLLALGIAAGFLLGTAIGDHYAGVSTWSMLRGNPNRFTGILLSSLAVSLAFTAYFRQRGRTDALQRQAREAQLRLLQSQLEPHMLFNTLANLRVLIGLDPPRAQAMLDRLIAFLRGTLDASRSDSGTLAAEFERSADYLALMQVRMGPRLVVALDLPEALRNATVPPLLLQPLVENAIRHGLEPHIAGGRIEIAARRDGARLLLTVRDSGAGLGGASTASTPGSGFGLQQVRQRLQALHGTRAGLELHPAEGGGTRAEIRLPFDAIGTT
jgi:hypothetical protein